MAGAAVQLQHVPDGARQTRHVETPCCCRCACGLRTPLLKGAGRRRACAQTFSVGFTSIRIRHSRCRTLQRVSASAGSGVGFGAKAKPETLEHAAAAEAFERWAQLAGVESPKLRMAFFDGAAALGMYRELTLMSTCCTDGCQP